MSWTKLEMRITVIFQDNNFNFLKPFRIISLILIF